MTDRLRALENKLASVIQQTWLEVEYLREVLR